MKPCPSDDLLAELSDDRSQGSELDDLEKHVETCADCQRRLEKITRGRDERATLKETLHPGDDRYRTVPPVNREDADMLDESRACPAEWPIVPGYEIVDKLGEGGMGVVYKARQLGLDRLVALKMIRRGVNSQSAYVARFRIEAQAVARLRHPNILQIFEIGDAGGMPFFSLELLEGGSLAARLRGNPQPARASAELVVTLARAVHIAHRAGIIHRDLKPSNILFGADGVPKVADFGLAKRLESTDMQTETGVIVGTPSYMAPEQATGRTRDIGPPADVYALGAIFYEMVSGRPPFAGDTPLETVRQVVYDDVVAPRRLAPRLDRDLETICLKCLQKDQHRRFESADALADDLERYLRGEPIKARPTSPWERGAKWARRRPFTASAAVLSVVAVFGSFLGALLYQRNELAKRDHENDRIMKATAEGFKTLDSVRESMEKNDLPKAMAALTGLKTGLAEESAVGLRDVRTKAEALSKTSITGWLTSNRVRMPGVVLTSFSPSATRHSFGRLGLPGWTSLRTRTPRGTRRSPRSLSSATAISMARGLLARSRPASNRTNKS